MNNVESIFAAKLLGVKAIKLQPSNPFTWASGWKSPFYCDNRKTLSFPDLRTFVKVELTRLVMEHHRCHCTRRFGGRRPLSSLCICPQQA